MRSPFLSVGFLLLLLASGCLEPGPTPLGPEIIETPLPDDAILYRVSGADSLGLTAQVWEDSVALFDSEMLFCGLDSLTGFRAEPVWVFDASELGSYDGAVTSAWLQLNFPDSSPDFPEDGDNPDLGRDVRVRLWRLDGEPDGANPLSTIFDLGDATQVPLHRPTREDDYEPFPLELSGEGFLLPPELVRGWIDDAQRVTLGLEWVDPDAYGAGERGMIRLYSLRSTPLASDSTTAAQLKIDDGGGTRHRAEALEDGFAAARLGGQDQAGALVLATGLPRSAHLSVDLPASLRNPDLMVIRARLALWPDSSLLFGASPADRSDNLLSGLPFDEGGLTLHLRAADDSLSGSAGLEEGGVLKSELPVFGESLQYNEAGDSLLSRSQMKEPLWLPLTTWVQDWANGDDENFGLTLELNGATERLRQAGWDLDPTDPERRPRLEILYVWRPDFE